MNKQLNSVLNMGTTLGTQTIISPIVSSLEGDYIDYDKYVFIQEKDGNVIQKITLSDFGNIGNERKGIFVKGTSNIRDIPQITFKKYDNPFKNGQDILDSKFSEKIVSFNLVVITDGINEVESTISNLEYIFNSGGKIQFNRNGNLETLQVRLNTFVIKEVYGYRAELEVSFVSDGDPLFQTEEIIKTYYNKTGDIQIIVSGDSSHTGFFADFLFVVQNVTGTINQVTLTYNGYTITLNNTVVSGNAILFSGRQGKVFVDGVEKIFLGQFTQIPERQQIPVNITFAGGGTISYNLVAFYNNNKF